MSGLLEQVGKTITGLFGREEQRPVVKRPKPATAPGSGFLDVNAFKKQLDRLLEHQSGVLTGRVNLIGLERCRDHFGARWSQIEPRAHEIAQGVINRHLAPGDIFTRYSDMDYLLILASVGEGAGKLKCQAIAEEISRKLLGDGMPAEAAEVKSAMVTADGRLQFVNDTHPNAASSTLSESIEETSNSRPLTANDIDVGPEVTLVVDLDRIIANLKFRYRPMLDVKKQTLSAYRILPVSIGPLGEPLMGRDLRSYIATRVSSAEFDARQLKRGLNDLVRGVNSGNRFILDLPITYDTLQALSDRRNFLNSCRAIPELLRSSIIFELIDVPPGVPLSRLSELLLALKPYCMRISVQIGIEERDMSRYRYAGAGSVSLNAHQFEHFPETPRVAALGDFAERARKVGLEAFAFGVSSPSDAVAALHMGYEYIGGDAISNFLDMPQGTVPLAAQVLHARLAHA